MSAWQPGDEDTWSRSGVLATLATGVAFVCVGVVIAGGWRAWLPPSAATTIGVALTLGLVALGIKWTSFQRSALKLAAKAGAKAERRRVAMDLHDGIAQDLALIATYSEQIERAIGQGHPVVVAARRALLVTRATICDLTEPPVTEAPVQALESLARELEERFSIVVAFDAPQAQDLTPQAAGQLRRIIQEAVTNAVRHGGATRVLISLGGRDPGVALRVIDNGGGIACPGAPADPEGFGVSSMRERAAALGGHLVIEPLREGGTALEVVVP